jgi:putative heme-binding domain-containing protein
MTTEALLRSLLTPSAAVESGYRLYRVELRNGTLLEGFLVRQDENELVLRRPGEQDRRIAMSEVYRSGFTRRSVMPDGLLEAMTAEEVADLFSYLRTLK